MQSSPFSSPADRRARRQPTDHGVTGGLPDVSVLALDLDHQALGKTLASSVKVATRSLYDDFVLDFRQRALRRFRCLWYGVVLTLIGVMVDKGQVTRSMFLQTIAAPRSRAPSFVLQLDNVYHSPWYVGIVGLILLSLAVCTFKRVIPARLPPLRAVKIDQHAAARPIRRDRRSEPGVQQRYGRVLSPRAAGVYASAPSTVRSGVLPTNTTGRDAACSSRTPVS